MSLKRSVATAAFAILFQIGFAQTTHALSFSINDFDTKHILSTLWDHSQNNDIGWLSGIGDIDDAQFQIYFSYFNAGKDDGEDSGTSENHWTLNDKKKSKKKKSHKDDDGQVFDKPKPKDTAPVPEPSTLILLGTGLAGLIRYSRRKQ